MLMELSRSRCGLLKHHSRPLIDHYKRTWLQQRPSSNQSGTSDIQAMPPDGPLSHRAIFIPSRNAKSMLSYVISVCSMTRTTTTLPGTKGGTPEQCQKPGIGQLDDKQGRACLLLEGAELQSQAAVFGPAHGPQHHCMLWSCLYIEGC